ncbi:MAG TPA: DUF5131 family protein [Opitutaceae bacterium]
MAENSKISWTTHTFNPWIGCSKVSPACRLCYAMMLMAVRYGRVEWGPGKPRSRTSNGNWKKVRSWDRQAAKDGTRPRVFCASLADWLDHEVPIEWLADLLELIRTTTHLDWLLLTKRPEQWRARLEAVCEIDGDSIAWSWLKGNAPANVWFGFSAEDAGWFDWRWNYVKHIPARVVFCSNEPSLGRLVLPADFLALGSKAWVINGGESGHGCQPMDEAHPTETLRQCQEAGVPFWMKQMGGAVDSRHELSDIPEHLRVRQLPIAT